MMEVLNGDPIPGPSTQYEENFPSLPSVGTPLQAHTTNIESFAADNISTIIEIPVSELKGDSKRQSDVCGDISKSCGVEIVLTNCKNKSLSVMINGPRSQVEKAKSQVTQSLHMQGKRVIKINHEYHRHLIGYKGMRKRAIEEKTLTKIIVPNPESKSDEIVIEGPHKCLESAELEIRKTIKQFSEQVRENLNIEQEYHVFINGPRNKTLNKIQTETGAKINIPPYTKKSNEITVVGKKEEVAKAVKQINDLIESLKKCYVNQLIPVDVDPSKWDYIIGPRNNGITEIFEQTGMFIDPPTVNSNQFRFRGDSNNIGVTLVAIYKKANSTDIETVTAPRHLHRLLIGKNGAALSETRKGYPGVSINFPEIGEHIKIEGPVEEVSAVKDRLQARVVELMASHHLETLDVDPKYQGKLLDFLRQYFRSRKLNVRVVKATECGMPENEHHIFLEGEISAVETTKADALKMVKKWTNEKTKDVIVEPRIQDLLRNDKPAPINEIYNEFKEVSVRWPQDNSRRFQSSQQTNNAGTSSPTTSHIVQLSGPRDQVDAAYEKFTKLVKKVKDENYEQEFSIFEDCRDRILGPTICKLLKDTNTRIRYFDREKTRGVIFGVQSNVETAIDHLERLQRSLATIEEVTITLPSWMLTKKAGNSSACLRSIREQCEGVQLKSVSANPRKLIISGPPQSIDKAKGLVDSILNNMPEGCTEAMVNCDPMHHGQLIGRNGVNLKRFRERYNVEVLIPEQNETDPKLANEIYLVGEKDAVSKAAAELQQTIKNWEDEGETSIECDSDMLQDLKNYIFAFRYPELENVKTFYPKSTPPPNSNQAAVNGNGQTNIKISIRGPKSCLQEAEQCLQTVIEDIKLQKTVTQPITEQTHSLAFRKLRSTLPEIERSHKVLIKLHLEKEPIQNGESTIYGHITYVGPKERIDDAILNGINPLLPVTEVAVFPQEFYGKLFVSEQPQQQVDRTQGNRRGRQISVLQKSNQKGNQSENGESTPAITRLIGLQRKYGVIINVPKRTSSEQITISGIPEAVQSCKKELEALGAKLQAEKADWEARTYEETLNVEKRFLNRVISGHKHQAFEKHGVAIFTRGQRFSKNNNNAAVAAVDKNANENAPKTNGETSLDQPSTPPDLSRFAGFTLLDTTLVPLIIQGYKEKVQLVREELEKVLEECSTFECQELVIPRDTHARLIGSQRSSIRPFEEKYDVEVEFPPRGCRENQTEIVLVLGPKSKADAAANELAYMSNELCYELTRVRNPNESTTKRPQNRLDIGIPAHLTKITSFQRGSPSYNYYFI
nr:high density lipoprotein receptor (hdl) [Hymenolepis microstoma]